jgi:hypothetical protein
MNRDCTLKNVIISDLDFAPNMWMDLSLLCLEDLQIYALICMFGFSKKEI